MGEEEKSTAAEVQKVADVAAEVQQHENEIVPTVGWYRQITYDDAKNFIRAEIVSIARSFIAVGYYLKLVRDGDLYREDHYTSIWDFAQVEFGLSKSTASRYMSMNDRFSAEGNSPVVDQKYKDFSKSKLQEMLSLTDEQLEQVTPQMKVQEIRAMRQPKEIPYFELEGQMDLETDFPEVLPEVPEMPAIMQQPAAIQTTMTLEEMMGEEEPEETVATSHQESAAEKQRSGKCLHNPLYECSLTNEEKSAPATGEDCNHHCCWECQEHGNCNIECYVSISRESLEIDADREGAAEPVSEPPEYDRKLLEDMIRIQKEQLEYMGPGWKARLPEAYTKHCMMLRAYEMLLAAQDAADQEPEAVLQLKRESEASRWIPVTERLPEDGYYLATLDGELVDQEEPFTGMCGIENGKWDDEDCVIAWMPLPEKLILDELLQVLKNH